MQAVLAATCTLFGVLWMRAVVRVRRSVLQRSAMLKRMAALTSGIDGEVLSVVVNAIVRLQNSVRRRREALVRARLEAMEAYEATTPYRNHMLWLLNMVVALYLATCLYLIALFGELERGALGYGRMEPCTLQRCALGCHWSSLSAWSAPAIGLVAV